MKLELFGVDSDKTEFVVFYLDRGEELNAYVWVYENKKVRITGIYALESYCAHTVEPFYVGPDMPEELIENAYETLKSMGKDDLSKLLEKFNAQDAQLKENEEDYAEREAYEDGVLKDLRDGNYDEDGMMWLM